METSHRLTSIFQRSAVLLPLIPMALLTGCLSSQIPVASIQKDSPSVLTPNVMPAYPVLIPNDGAALPIGVSSQEAVADCVEVLWKMSGLEIIGGIGDGTDETSIYLNAFTGECIADGYNIPVFNNDGEFPLTAAGKLALETTDSVFKSVSGQGTDPMTGFEYEFNSVVGVTVVAGVVEFTMSGSFAVNFGSGSLVLTWQTATLPGSVTEPLLPTGIVVNRTDNPFYSFVLIPNWLE
jgi:hypothetical protein